MRITLKGDIFAFHTIGVSLYMADTTITGMENSYILIYNSFKYYLLLQLEQFGRLLRERQDPRLPL